MRRGRGVTPPSVERSFGLPYTFGLFELSPLSRDVPGPGARPGARGRPEAGRPSGREPLALARRTHRLLLA